MMFQLVITVTLTFGVWLAKQGVRIHGLLPLAWRWLSGMPLNGEVLTDAGWRAPGTRALTETGRVVRFWYRPRFHRARSRILRTAIGVVTAWGLIFYPAATLIALAVAAAAGAVYGAWRAVAWWQARKHRLTWVYPAHVVAAPLAGYPVASDPGDWLTVEPDRSRVVAELPAEFSPDPAGRERLVQALTAKLGIESPDVSWRLAGPRPRLELTQSQPPPARVTLADVRAVLEALKDDELLWGLGRKGAPVKSSLSADSPHFGLSMGSGAGKSVTARALLAQMLHRGGIGLILDCKMISHQWAAGLPNVVIARRPAEIHAALCWLGREVARRNEVALAGADMDGNVHASVGPRLIVVAEELNATVAMLRAHWREVRAKDDPVRSPALDALDGASFMGRQVLANIIYIGQRLSDKATGGGGDARENIGVIAFARYRPSTWKMLAGDHPMPPKNNAPGRLQVVSDQVQEAQGILMTPREARELALSGVVSPLPYGMPGARATGEAVSRELVPVSASDQGLPQFHPGISPAPVSGPVTLREAVDAGLLGPLTLPGARTARHRNPDFPRPVGRRRLADEYSPEALSLWAASRRE